MVDEGAPLKEKIRQAVPWSAASALSSLALSLLGTILLVRYLDPEQYGVWALLLALAGPINLFVSLGYTHSLTRFIPGLNDLSAVSETVWPILVRRILYTIAAAMITLVAFPFYSDRLGLDGYFGELLVYQIALVANMGILYIVLSFSLRFRQREVLLLSMPFQALMVGSTAVGIWLEADLLYFVAIAATVASLNLLACVSLFRLSFGIPPVRTWLRRMPETREQAHYRRNSYVGDYGVTFLNTEVDRYLIAVFTSPADVAIYAVATTVVERLRSLLPSQMLRPLLEATFYRRFEETNDPREIERMFRLIFVLTAAVCFFYVAMFVPVGKEALAVIFREEYAASYLIVVVYLSTMFLHQMPAGLVLKALKRADVMVYAQSAVALNLALGIYLVSIHGGIGMAVATAISVSVKNGIMFVWAKRLITLRMPWVGLGKCILAAALSSALLIEVKTRLELTDWVVVVALTVPAALLYLLILRVLAPLDASEKAILVTAMPPSVQRPIKLLLG